MSQHRFSTTHNGEKTRLLMGWDKPLQGYFLVIEKASDEDEPFYSNLLHAENPYPKTLEPFLEVLENLGIQVPLKMVNAVQEDGKNDIGNKEIFYPDVI